MAITQFDALADFDTVSGVTEDVANFYETSPGFLTEAGDYVLEDNGRCVNEVFKFWVKIADVDNTSFKFMFGANSSGAGQYLQFDFDATNMFVRLVTATGVDVAYTSSDAQMDIRNMISLADGDWVPIQIEIQDNKVRCRFRNIICYEFKTFSPVGNYFGFATLTGSGDVHVSDLFWYTDQIVYGNVNLNGTPNSLGIVVLYNQSTFEVVEYRAVDADGEYYMFIDDDPANLNKYFMYGFIDGETNIQPRGVSNITL